MNSQKGFIEVLKMRCLRGVRNLKMSNKARKMVIRKQLEIKLLREIGMARTHKIMGLKEYIHIDGRT